MEKYVISVSRQFGSLGRPIAKKLSELLDIEYYDRDIVDKTAREMNLPVSVVSEEEERAKNSFFNMKYPLGPGTSTMQNKLFAIQRQIILDLADRESCIIVGRCAYSILKGTKNHMSIYIYASLEQRMKNCIESLGMNEAFAKKMIYSVDKARALYNMEYARELPNSEEACNLMVDSGFFGIEGSAELIRDTILKRFQVRF